MADNQMHDAAVKAAQNVQIARKWLRDGLALTREEVDLVKQQILLLEVRLDEVRS